MQEEHESGRGNRAGRAWEGKQGRKSMRVGGETGQEEHESGMGNKAGRA